MSVLGSVIGFMPGSVGVSTGANLPAKASALITPDGDQNADGAFILFTPSLSSVSWRVSVSSAGDFSAAWRQYAGTGDPGRGVYFDGKDASGRIRPGPYYVRIELNGGVAVDTATIALNVGTMGIAGKVKVGKLNTDDNPNAATRFNISAIPTMLFFKNGKVEHQLVGVHSKADIKKTLDDLVR